MDFEVDVNDEDLIRGPREKRFVRFNSATQIFMAMFFFVPITTVLPILSQNYLWGSKYPNLPEKLENEVAKAIFSNPIRIGRSIKEKFQDVLKLEPINSTRSKDKKKFESLDDQEYDFIEHPIVQKHVDRLKGYFYLLKIPEVVCQQRYICELSSQPEKFNPISDIFLNRIRDPEIPSHIVYPGESGESPTTNTHNNPFQNFATNSSETFTSTSSGSSSNSGSSSSRSNKSLYSAYNLAADLGITHGPGKCEENFRAKCPQGVEQRLNLPLLQFCNVLSRQFNLQFNDHDDDF